MFGKKKCSHCNKKLDKDFDFCPYCASPIANKKDYGLLGKDDNFELDSPFLNSKSESNGFLDKIFESAFKIVEKQIQKISEEEMRNMQNRNPARNNSMNPDFKLFINGRQVNLPGNIAGFQVQEINGNGVDNLNNNASKISKQPKTKIPKVSEETMKKSAKLPRKEAKTKLTRTAERVIYELDSPGIESLNNVLVNKLENSLEIKIYTAKAVYFKTLPIKLPLVQYSIKDDKLVLEFKAYK